ncbi:conserved exported hypothetical protein [Candidatus Methylobacter favarea]|uniref:Lipoprotein n=1 Tax=Candidatus Methylobacter favarea TaxID=2707345 RepID=A0A8S0X2C2_9GAMM|nr:hypothetical protein [Candidatus Methylobacter favarea]CAA9891792.1 conserved exported hypothetical protein [Candidatus Methylobacter favarea]
MKKLSPLLLILCCSFLIACGTGQEINGHSTRTAYRSVKGLKERLSPENRIEFEVAFWTIRDAKKNDDEFLDTVDGKTPTEIIALGKEIYQQRKNEGFEAYSQYSSWEDMIAKFGQERTDPDIRKGKNASKDAKDKANNVLYKL